MERQPKLDRTPEEVASRSNPTRLIREGYKAGVAREYLRTNSTEVTSENYSTVMQSEGSMDFRTPTTQG